MPGQVPNIIWLYRIVHITNLEYILHHGICCRNHPGADPDYINIGDSELIAKRNDYPVKIIPPGGNLGEYVPFYFGPLSPMLYKIKTGHGGITQRPQSDIVYIICNAANVIQHCQHWCFTDGHAKTAITEFYNSMDNIGEVDWGIVKEKQWSNTEDDFDRMRRKQAEFLVKEHVPVSCISHIVVYNEERRILVQELVNKSGLNIRVSIRTQLYY
jgi:hypothetical protein